MSFGFRFSVSDKVSDKGAEPEPGLRPKNVQPPGPLLPRSICLGDAFNAGLELAEIKVPKGWLRLPFISPQTPFVTCGPSTVPSGLAQIAGFFPALKRRAIVAGSLRDLLMYNAKHISEGGEGVRLGAGCSVRMRTLPVDMLVTRASTSRCRATRRRAARRFRGGGGGLASGH